MLNKKLKHKIKIIIFRTIVLIKSSPIVYRVFLRGYWILPLRLTKKINSVYVSQRNQGRPLCSLRPVVFRTLFLKKRAKHIYDLLEKYEKEKNNEN